jgi:hypothetical protein
VPAEVKARVEALLGARVSRGVRVWGGYAPSATFRLYLVDGRRVVFKGVDRSANDVMQRGIRAEERVYRELGSVIVPWAPRSFGSISAGDWFAVLLEDVGPPQVPPWTEQLAEAAMRDFARFHASTLGRADLPGWVPRHAHHAFARTWQTLVETPGGLDACAALAGEHERSARLWLDEYITTLRSTAERLMEVAQPHALLHFDTRSDNLRVLPGGQLRLFDWPYTAIGPHEFDMVGLAQSITAEGGPGPELCVQWYAAGIEVRSEALSASIASIAGYFADRAWQPPIPGLPRVRSIQRRQLRSSLAWCARHLGLADPSWLSGVPD